MNPTQMAQQVLTQLNQQPIQYVSNKAKPIFIIRVPARLSNTEMAEIRKTISKDNINDDYHVMIIPSNVDEFMFEMYNADKIDVQQWNGIVTKLNK
jgi:diphthamide biosynthesis methyltransferase